MIWIGALLSISYFGPGFNISISGYLLLVLAGLFFLLDLLFDLIFGLFPFYKKMQGPVLPQGKVLRSLYRDGYQNSQEFPIYSVLYPLVRWLF